MARRLDCPTCLNPSTSVQNLCESAMSRTLITRWLMPPGVTASVGASGTIGEVPSAIIWLLRSSFLGDYMGAPSALPISAVEPAPGETEQALRHEDHHRDEHEPDRDQVILCEKARQPLPQQQEEGGAENRPNQGADAADDVVDDDLTR